MIGILGGGLTGLTLGSLLPDSLVLEKESTPGGLCRTLQEDGYTFDSGGSHVVFSKSSETLQFMLSILGESVVKNRRNTKVYYKRRFVKYPFENGLSNLPLKENYECLLEFLRMRLRKASGSTPEPSNLKEWFTHKFGKAIAEKYLLPYNEKIWRMKPEEMGTEWVSRVPDPPLEDVIKSSLGIETEGYVHQLEFYYPLQGGIQRLTDSLARKCNLTESNFEVQQVSRVSDGFQVSGNGKSYDFETLISTIPLTELVEVMDSAPKDIVATAQELTFNSLVTVMLGIDDPKINDLSWVYFPGRKDGIFYRASFPSNYSPKTSPVGKSSVMAEITCFKDDETWKRSDEELVESVKTNLHENRIIDKDDVRFSRVKRTEHAYVVYDLNHSRNVSKLRRFMSEQGIELCGRFGRFEYLNMDACIGSARELAARIGGCR
ncbi:MAG: protoporphyrinogen/coproporphyrinogen oxidase [Thermoplasmata archaeon]